jgi:N,N'-diacetyllegionaminate synthase
MIKAAAETGIDLIKFQSFKADKLRKSYTDYAANYAYYKRHELSDSDHYFIAERCNHYGIDWLTTVYDLDTIEFLADEIGLKQVKIASPDMSNWELIDACLENFCKVFISTGMHSTQEIYKLGTYIYNKPVVLLHCVSQYPVSPDNLNMNRLEKCHGFSDHTPLLAASKLAIAMGADYIERHYTLSRYLPGRDQAISSTPEEFAELAHYRDSVKLMMGSHAPKGLTAQELTDREKFAGRFYGN